MTYQGTLKTIIGTAVALYAAGTLFAHAGAAPLNDPNTPPTGCTITGAWEDGSRIAQCPNGIEWHYDPDGLGPYCPHAAKKFGESGWHTSKHVHTAYRSCEHESRQGRK